MHRQTGPKKQSRHSARIEKTEAVRVMDDAARHRRLKRQLDALQHDNAHEDPHANLVWHKAIPKFEDNVMIGGSPQQGGRKREMKIAEEPTKKKKKLRSEHTKQRFRKNFTMLLDEENLLHKDDPLRRNAYQSATAPPSKIPQKHFCTACGFPSKYTCIRCGARYCSIRCRDVHNDTRCMKYTL